MDKSQISGLLEEAKKQKNAFDTATVKCGLIGLSGAGKSSLINAIAGEKIAAVGSTEQTMEAQSFAHEGIEFVDLPGCGTQKWPQATYISDLGLESYDCFILVTSNRFYEADQFLFNELKAVRKKPCFLVRTKIDRSIEDEAHDNQLSEEDTLDKIRKNLISSISAKDEKVYLVSSRHPTKWDLGRLVDDISSSQTGVKKDRFIAGMATWSKEALEKKRLVARKIVSWSAVASAANGLNPIPGVDVAVDVGVLSKMCKEINSVYGLSEEQIAYVKATSPKLADSVEFNGLAQNISRWAARYLVAEGIVALLKAMGKSIAIKSISKFLPFIGSIVAAGVGYKMTTAFGERYLEEAENLAEQLLEQVLKMG